MTKPETPLHLLSTVVNCLTVLIEDSGADERTVDMYALMRDMAVNIALDMQTERREAA